MKETFQNKPTYFKNAKLSDLWTTRVHAEASLMGLAFKSWVDESDVNAEPKPWDGVLSKVRIVSIYLQI